MRIDRTSTKKVEMPLFDSDGGDYRASYFLLAQKIFPRGVASKNPKQVLDFHSAPTAFEPTVRAL